MWKEVIALADATGKKSVRGRIFNCLQYEYNPKTGACLNFNENNILSCIKHKTITRYAYIKHDKDTVTEADIETGKGAYTDADLGRPKGVHWHIVLETKNNAYSVSTIAKWLGIPESMVDIPKGRGAFIDCVEYLRHSDIHQALKGKYEYDASEVKANFDWEIEVERLVLRKTEYEKPLSETEYVKNCVLYKGMTIAEVVEKYPTLYQEQMTQIEKLRLGYLNKFAPMPQFRVNYYIYGGSGSGKDTMAHSLAKALFPGREYDDDVYFEIGAKKVTFSGYDGQPVIIWSEFRAETFVETLGGYESVLGTIDIIPKNKREHRKFGDIRLVNAVNIVTSTQDYRDFLRGLIKEGDPDPTQAHRRFPIIIPIHERSFDIMVNSGYLNSPEFSEYVTWRGLVQGSYAEIARTISSRPDLFERVEKELSAPIVDAHNVIVDSISSDKYEGKTDDEVYASLKAEGFGSYKTAEEIEQERKAAEKEKLLREQEQERRRLSEKAETDAMKREHLLNVFAAWFWFTEDDFAPVEARYTYAGACYRDITFYEADDLSDSDFKDVLRRQLEYPYEVPDNELIWLATEFSRRIGHGYDSFLLTGYSASELREAILSAWGGNARQTVRQTVEPDGETKQEVVFTRLLPFSLSVSDKDMLREARVFAVDNHTYDIKQVGMPTDEAIVATPIETVEVEDSEPFDFRKFLEKRSEGKTREEVWLHGDTKE